MNTGKLIAGVALVLIVGVLIGSLGTRFYLEHRYGPFMPEHGNRTAFIMKKLSKDLNLNENQKPVIERIVTQTEERLHEHFLQKRSEIAAIIDEGFAQMKKELNEDQNKKLDALREEFQKHRRTKGERR